MDYIKVSTNLKHFTFIVLAFMVHSIPWKSFGSVFICVSVVEKECPLVAR